VSREPGGCLTIAARTIDREIVRRRDRGDIREQLWRYAEAWPEK
jgi:hypothetical protein